MEALPARVIKGRRWPRSCPEPVSGARSEYTYKVIHFIRIRAPPPRTREASVRSPRSGNLRRSRRAKRCRDGERSLASPAPKSQNDVPPTPVFLTHRGSVRRDASSPREEVLRAKPVPTGRAFVQGHQETEGSLGESLLVGGGDAVLLAPLPYRFDTRWDA